LKNKLILHIIFMNSDQIYAKITSGEINTITFNCEYISNDRLRKFHNWIKITMLLKSKKDTSAESLLDIGTGRGGDLMKWCKAKIKYITAFDPDKKALYEKHEFDGAIKRYSTMKSIPNMPKVFFWNISATDPKLLDIINGKDNNKIYDIISCYFTFHYLIKDIESVLYFVSIKLKKGGEFIGTVSDGDLIKLNGNVSNDIINITQCDDETYNYVMFSEKTDRITYFDYKGQSEEYYTHKDYLVEMCKKYDLVCKNISNFHEWKNSYKEELSEQEMVSSFLNFSFVFVKV
jgi:SAM-dependent methyltransferase